MGLDGPEPHEVTQARLDGVASSYGEVITGVTSVAAPIRGSVRAAVAVLYVTSDNPRVAVEVQRAAAALTQSNR
jgi:DNA-binding IclR family transcriptional regulator